jgi:hypothetical protein
MPTFKQGTLQLSACCGVCRAASAKAASESDAEQTASCTLAQKMIPFVGTAATAHQSLLQLSLVLQPTRLLCSSSAITMSDGEPLLSNNNRNWLRDLGGSTLFVVIGTSSGELGHQCRRRLNRRSKLCPSASPLPSHSPDQQALFTASLDLPAAAIKHGQGQASQAHRYVAYLFCHQILPGVSYHNRTAFHACAHHATAPPAVILSGLVVLCCHAFSSC